MSFVRYNIYVCVWSQEDIKFYHSLMVTYCIWLSTWLSWYGCSASSNRKIAGSNPSVVTCCGCCALRQCSVSITVHRNEQIGHWHISAPVVGRGINISKLIHMYKHGSVVVDMLFLCTEQYQIKINILNITSICQPTVSKFFPVVKIKNIVYLYIIKSTKAKRINSH